MDALTHDVKHLVRQSWRLFSQAHHAWAKIFAQVDLNTSTFPIIESIVAKPGITQQEIADELNIDKSCTSRSCRYLENNGFIRREKNEECTHGLRCYPLEKAISAHETVLEAIQGQIHALFDQESQQRIQDATEYIAHMTEQFKKV